MATVVSIVARTRNENDIVPMDVSVLKGKGGKGKDGKGKDGKDKDGEGKAKDKDDKDKTDPKSNSNKDKKCFYCDKIGHVKADCRKKKRNDEERKTTLPQNEPDLFTRHDDSATLVNVPASTSGGSASSLHQLTVPSHVSDDGLYRQVRIFALKACSPTGRVMVDYANEHEVREVQHKIQFQTASGELLEHHGEKLVPYVT